MRRLHHGFRLLACWAPFSHPACAQALWLLMVSDEQWPSVALSVRGQTEYGHLFLCLLRQDWKVPLCPARLHSLSLTLNPTPHSRRPTCPRVRRSAAQLQGPSAMRSVTAFPSWLGTRTKFFVAIDTTVSSPATSTPHRWRLLLTGLSSQPSLPLTCFFPTKPVRSAI